MLFSQGPKDEEEDLYDRKEEVRMVREAVKRKDRLVLVLGLRRLGKTSLVKVAIKEFFHTFVDVRRMYDESKYVRSANLITRLLNGMPRKVTDRLADLLGRIEGISFHGGGIEFRPTKRGLRVEDVLEKIDEWAEDANEQFVVAFDEAQYLRFSNYGYDRVIAWTYDNLRNITFILTGSEVGMMERFLKLKDSRSFLYGRTRREIMLRRFNHEESLGYLKEGLNEVGVKYDVKEVEEAVEKLDGIVGWLNMYGYNRGMNILTHNEALRRTVLEAKDLVAAEFKELEPQDRYRAVMVAAAKTSKMRVACWNDIRRYVIGMVGIIDDKTFQTILNNLVSYGYLEKIDEGKYEISDPIIFELFI
jgi:AAA+ ATPase superfamily predicted ATPase